MIRRPRTHGLRERVGSFFMRDLLRGSCPSRPLKHSSDEHDIPAVTVALVRRKRLETICASFASDWGLSLLDAASPFSIAAADLASL
jgi:hypothetical protein